MMFLFYCFLEITLFPWGAVPGLWSSLGIVERPWLFRIRWKFLSGLIVEPGVPSLFWDWADINRFGPIVEYPSGLKARLGERTK